MTAVRMSPLVFRRMTTTCLFATGICMWIYQPIRSAGAGWLARHSRTFVTRDGSFSARGQQTLSRYTGMRLVGGQVLSG